MKKFETPNFEKTEFEAVAYLDGESNTATCSHDYKWNSSVLLPWQDHYGQSSWICSKCGDKKWE